MAFLDNNIITLDAVLTDVGRKRLAQGNGSFVISQFGLGDDEINYGLYDVNNSSGSAYYDLNVLQTPVFEAITNSTTALKYNLISYPNALDCCQNIHDYFLVNFLNYAMFLIALPFQ